MDAALGQAAPCQHSCGLFWQPSQHLAQQPQHCVVQQEQQAEQHTNEPAWHPHRRGPGAHLKLDQIQRQVGARAVGLAVSVKLEPAADAAVQRACGLRGSQAGNGP